MMPAPAVRRECRESSSSAATASSPEVPATMPSRLKALGTASMPTPAGAGAEIKLGPKLGQRTWAGACLSLPRLGFASCASFSAPASPHPLAPALTPCSCTLTQGRVEQQGSGRPEAGPMLPTPVRCRAPLLIDGWQQQRLVEELRLSWCRGRRAAPAVRLQQALYPCPVSGVGLGRVLPTPPRIDGHRLMSCPSGCLEASPSSKAYQEARQEGEEVVPGCQARRRPRTGVHGTARECRLTSSPSPHPHACSTHLPRAEVHPA